jgi:hypothetical protein
LTLAIKREEKSSHFRATISRPQSVVLCASDTFVTTNRSRFWGKGVNECILWLSNVLTGVVVGGRAAPLVGQQRVRPERQVVAGVERAWSKWKSDFAHFLYPDSVF